jgi:hypothetical protein
MSLMLLGILNSQAAGGGGGAFDLLETTTLSTSASSVTFSGLGAYSDYKHLQIRSVARSDFGSVVSGALRVRFSGDSGSNYVKYHRLAGNGSSVSSNGELTGTSLELYHVPGANADSGVFNSMVMDILDFNSTSKFKTARTMIGSYSSSTSRFVHLMSGLYMSTSAITSTTFTLSSGANFIAGTRFSLIGIK